MSNREFDLVLWGATGFTGALVAEYLLGSYGVNQSLRWALAGRNEIKLQELRTQLSGTHTAAQGLPIILADSEDPTTLAAMVASTHVVCSVVGPYARYGSKLVEACVSANTHYCDLTGEVHWMRQVIDAHTEAARASGTRIVHSCGFDCIPSDLGVYWLQRAMRERHGVPCREVKFRVESFSGGFSGGTVACLLNMLDAADEDASVRAVIDDPYALNPQGGRRGLDPPDRTLPEYDLDFDAWVVPFVMAPINTRVVRRSNALLDFAYGDDFRYEEGVLMPFGRFGFPLAALMTTGTGLFNALTQVRGLRSTLARMLPAPGEGPDRQKREQGQFKIQLLGKHPGDAGKNLRLSVCGDQDPGYGSTAGMLGEAAVCLALDDLSSPGGVLTPAVAMGESLLVRLQEKAGLTFEPLTEME